MPTKLTLSQSIVAGIGGALTGAMVLGVLAASLGSVAGLFLGMMEFTATGGLATAVSGAMFSGSVGAVLGALYGAVTGPMRSQEFAMPIDSEPPPELKTAFAQPMRQFDLDAIDKQLQVAKQQGEKKWAESVGKKERPVIAQHEPETNYARMIREGQLVAKDSIPQRS